MIRNFSGVSNFTTIIIVLKKSGNRVCLFCLEGYLVFSTFFHIKFISFNFGSDMRFFRYTSKTFKWFLYLG